MPIELSIIRVDTLSPGTLATVLTLLTPPTQVATTSNTRKGSARVSKYKFDLPWTFARSHSSLSLSLTHSSFFLCIFLFYSLFPLSLRFFPWKHANRRVELKHLLTLDELRFSLNFSPSLSHLTGCQWVCCFHRRSSERLVVMWESAVSVRRARNVLFHLAFSRRSIIAERCSLPVLRLLV